jgi:hypothetical protein
VISAFLAINAPLCRFIVTESAGAVNLCYRLKSREERGKREGRMREEKVGRAC